jgi:hypothetical protein
MLIMQVVRKYTLKTTSDDSCIAGTDVGSTMMAFSIAGSTRPLPWLPRHHRTIRKWPPPILSGGESRLIALTAALIASISYN